ncbi:MAG: methylenetetrahydrofolate reductase C-terminal domain-containing protein [Candidatus Thermoplasmatota archaeon]|nr:methylenetetrahydrofolate reductase C-terminal domain-containing protein [Candidatus Thermoplasmatota archaeon]
MRLINNDPVFLIGCSECATMCKTGGEEEILIMKKILEQKEITVTGYVILDPACNLQKSKIQFKNVKENLNKAKKLVVFSCGNGVQTVSEIFENLEVISGTNTLFLGEIKHANEFEKNCIMCGECIQEIFNGFCPVSRCPKHMLNGPCGGSRDGKCEVSSNLDCIWNTIYLSYKKKGQLNKFKQILAPKDWSKSLEFKRVI